MNSTFLPALRSRPLPLRGTAAALGGLLLAMAPSPASAGDWGKAVLNDKAPVASPAWTFCDLFKNNTLYEGDGFIQRVRYRGRYQGQWVTTSDDHDAGNPAPGGAHFWEHRRWRSGLDIDMAHNLKFISSFNHDTTPTFSGPRFVDSTFEMKLEWAPTDDFYIVVGKQKARITREWATSSAHILTMERSAIVNNVLSFPLWGVAVGFKTGEFDHEIGVYGVAYDNKFAWPRFDDAGASAIYRTSCPLTEATRLFFDYQYVDTSVGGGFSGNFAASPYEHVFAIGTESKWGSFGLITDLIFGLDRRDQTMEDTWGLVVMPYYDITDKLQFVAKYSYADNARIDRPQRHASRPYLEGLSTLYVGLNYYICGHNLKLMGGYEYATADRFSNGSSNDYQNDAWVLGIRTTW